MSDSEDFDPRFDPAFQRGFAGEITTTRRRPTTGAPSVLPATTSVAPQPSAPPPPPEPEIVDRPAAAAPEVEVAPAVPPRFFTGWTIAIAVVGALLILGGGWGVNTLIEYLKASQNGATPNFYLVLIGLFASPLAIILGLACGIGLLFLGATRRR